MKCPKCGRIYTEHPAISRTDNKTEICPRCGMVEALEQAGFTSKFIDQLEAMQETADEYNVQIKVEVPKYENGKKTTERITLKPRQE